MEHQDIATTVHARQSHNGNIMLRIPEIPIEQVAFHVEPVVAKD
jgi:hypothetical protein